jgi:hypothetical protein
MDTDSAWLMDAEEYTPVDSVDIASGYSPGAGTVAYWDNTTKFIDDSSTAMLTISGGAVDPGVTIYIVGSVTIPKHISFNGIVNIIGVGENAEINIEPTMAYDKVSTNYVIQCPSASQVKITDVKLNVVVPTEKYTLEDTSNLAYFIYEQANTTYENVVMNGNDSHPRTVYWYGGTGKKVLFDSVEITGFKCSESTNENAIHWGIITFMARNKTLDVKGLNLHDNEHPFGYSVGVQMAGGDNYAGSLLNIEPSAEININGGEIIPEIAISANESYPIQSVKIDGKAVKDFVSPYSLGESAVKSSLQISDQQLEDDEDQPTETVYTAYFGNISAEEINREDTFTVDVYMKSNEALSAGELNFACENGTIIDGVARELSTGNEDINFTFTNNKMSFYGNKVSAKEGLKVATLTVKADGSGKDVVLSLTDGAAGQTGSITDVDVTLKDEDVTSVTVLIFKNDKVSCTDYAPGKYLIKYSGEVPEGSVAVYNGESMFWSPAYEAWITLTDTDVSETIHNGDITINTAGFEEVSYDGDINGNGKINIVDAQIAYDIASGVYNDYSIATILMWMRSDVNKDTLVSALDARGIQYLIHGIEA